MSNVSDIFDIFKNKAKTLYPAHIQLTNPYQLEENTTAALAQGFGLAWGGGVNTKRLVGCKMSIERELKLILTRKFYATELNIDSKEFAEKLLFEDQKSFILYIEKNPAMESSSLAKIEFVSDNGIEFVYDERDNFLKLESSFKVEYFENLT